jgi:hypothetical protein
MQANQGGEARLLRPADFRRYLLGKEGVDGSSPSEGFDELPAKRHVRLPPL